MELVGKVFAFLVSQYILSAFLCVHLVEFQYETMACPDAALLIPVGKSLSTRTPYSIETPPENDFNDAIFPRKAKDAAGVDKTSELSRSHSVKRLQDL